MNQVSYEEFKLQFAQMYEHYERHRTDNITDPALRRAHPISTISGWDRDHDQTTDGSTNNGQALNDKAITNTLATDSHNQPEKSFKVSKSEQTDDDDVVDLENVKCVCEENVVVQDDTNPSTNDVDSTKEPTAQILNATESSKPVQSISSISQVYNEQLTGKTIVCNGDSEHAFDDDTISNITPAKQANVSGTDGGSDALRKTLEIDSYDMNEDNKEIVDEIVEEILTKSENLLDDCKRSLDENHQHLNETETTSSPVIKDEEIEHAVSEVVKGVRNIERKMKRDSENDTESQNTETDVKMKREGENIGDVLTSNIHNDETTELQNENQKTELVLSNAAIESTKEILDVDRTNDSVSETLTTANASDGIKDIVATIVNDVIENCVNQTVTDNGDVCDNDNDMNKMSIIDNINNNSSDVATNDSNDNAIIVDTIAPTTDAVSTLNADTVTAIASATDTATATTETETNPVEETNEEIIKGIVNEIVDKCVESEMNTATDNDDNNNNNNNNNDEDSALDKSGSETFVADTIDESSAAAADADGDGDGAGEQPNNGIGSAKFTSVATDNGSDNQMNDNRSAKLNRSQGTSISTSTQVENNHFGNLA